ncbi:MAG: glycosyltransferase family A protein [Candidatus Methanomethylicaceae archaeon]|nr:glycosyltransferase family A protein [Candidatus Verstraetearchaeota archaeon]
MKISVVIPTYNSSKTIKMTLSSVLLQTVQPDEIIVIDDGSTDDTVLILENYKPTITIFQQTNRGVASARNVLCQKAKGDLIAFLDHDDIWHPKYLEIQKMQYHQYSNAVAFFTGHINFYGYGEYHWTGVDCKIEVTPYYHLNLTPWSGKISFQKREEKVGDVKYV